MLPSVFHLKNMLWIKKVKNIDQISKYLVSNVLLCLNAGIMTNHNVVGQNNLSTLSPQLPCTAKQSVGNKSGLLSSRTCAVKYQTSRSILDGPWENICVPRNWQWFDHDKSHKHLLILVIFCVWTYWNVTASSSIETMVYDWYYHLGLTSLV